MMIEVPRDSLPLFSVVTFRPPQRVPSSSSQTEHHVADNLTSSHRKADKMFAQSFENTSTTRKVCPQIRPVFHRRND